MLSEKAFKKIQARLDERIGPPVAIDDAIRSFVHDLVPNGEIVRVPVAAVDTSKRNECFPNVLTQIAVHGGELVHGWTLWLWPKRMITAEFHGVWRSPTGELVDVTPKRETEIVFAIDPVRTHTPGRRVSNISKPLTADPRVQQYIDLNKKISGLIPVGPFQPTRELAQYQHRAAELAQALLQPQPTRDKR